MVNQKFITNSRLAGKMFFPLKILFVFAIVFSGLNSVPQFKPRPSLPEDFKNGVPVCSIGDVTELRIVANVAELVSKSLPENSAAELISYFHLSSDREVSVLLSTESVQVVVEELETGFDLAALNESVDFEEASSTTLTATFVDEPLNGGGRGRIKILLGNRLISSSRAPSLDMCEGSQPVTMSVIHMSKGVSIQVGTQEFVGEFGVSPNVSGAARAIVLAVLVALVFRSLLRKYRGVLKIWNRKQ